MADEKPSGAWGSSFVVFALAAVSAVYVALEPAPLVSSRPTDRQYDVHDIQGAAQDVDARLWQDPFAAVMRAAQERPDPEGRHAIANYQLPEGKTLLIGATLPGAPYPEAAETRRRLRYAILAALHTEGYLPSDEKHLGYLCVNDPPAVQQQPLSEVTLANASSSADGVLARSASSSAKSPCEANYVLPVANSGGITAPAPLPKIIAFEKFNSTEQSSLDPKSQRHIVVMWLDEDFLTAKGTPIASLRRLQRLTQGRAGDEFILLGPVDSTTLVAMVREAHSPPKSEDNLLASAPDISIYNFAATADDPYIVKLAGGQGTSLEELFRAAHLEYHRTVSSDGELATLVAEELGLRGVDPTRITGWQTDVSGKPVAIHGDHIALVSEWDTVYGEYLPESVAQAFKASDNTSEGWGVDAWITPFRYLRGLDGRLPYDRWNKAQTASFNENNDKKTGDQAAAATPDTANKFEGAEGQSQFDYLRRLAAAVKATDTELHQKGKGHIAAIGVLGSDVYDKLLILQALRPELPDALFFTTDLDGLLLPQNKTRYTRNLLVASSFGLTLDPRFQEDIPPFRDTYQTSVFRTARLAIEKYFLGLSPQRCERNKGTGNASGEHDCWLERPLLFQIGRSAQRMLPTGPENPPCGTATSGCQPDRDPNSRSIADFASVQPNPAKLYPELMPGSRFSAAMLLTVLFLGVAFSTRVLRPLSSPSPGRGETPALASYPRVSRFLFPALIALIVSLALCSNWPAIADFLTEHGSGEPMSLSEGISLWPPIALRVIGAGFSLWLIFYTLRSLDHNLKQTEKAMHLPSCRASLCDQWRNSSPRRGSPARLIGRIAAVIWFDKAPDDQDLDLQQQRLRGQDQNGRQQKHFEAIAAGSATGTMARFIRAAIGTITILALGSLLVPILGGANAPGRGTRIQSIYFDVTIIAVVLTQFLIFLVADATLLSRAFIKRLTAVATIWPAPTIVAYHTRFGLEGPDLADWLDMTFLAKRTRCITNLIYLPFLALAFLVISRSRMFDDFDVSLTIVVVQAIGILLVIGAVLSLRAAAENARRVAIEELEAKIIAAKGDPNTKEKAGQLEMLLAQIKNLNDGAFAPWSSQPLVKAVLLPLISYGGTALVHLYALPGT